MPPKAPLSFPDKLTQEVGSGVSELYQRYVCDYCQEDIPGLRIKCADCADFDLCLHCFSTGAQIGKHKNTHKYVFMNNGGFTIFSRPDEDDGLGRGFRHKRLSTVTSNGSNNGSDGAEDAWNAREEMRLLDAVEQFGYGNWKDISQYIESKTPEAAKEEYIKHFIHGLVGKHTWKENLRGFAVDHTQSADAGPLSPTLTGKLPPINVNFQEALLLGYMPHRDDFEDFDRDTENLVAQIADKSVEDEDVDVALKLAQCDIYERRLREQVRRKRVARDYQLVSKFYGENPIVQIGLNNKISPTKISNQVKAVKRGDGPKQELIDAMKTLTQFFTAQEFQQFVNNLCVEKELKVRVKELCKYRQHGLTKVTELVPFERERFKLDAKLKRLAKVRPGAVAPSKFLPSHGDYSLRAILDPDQDEKSGEGGFGSGFGGKRKKKRSKWNKKKIKTGRRLLLQQGCILTLADPPRRESTEDSATN
jgi:transcriptional adapter 2-beta